MALHLLFAVLMLIATIGAFVGGASNTVYEKQYFIGVVMFLFGAVGFAITYQLFAWMLEFI